MLRSEAFRAVIVVLLGGLACLFGLPSLSQAQDPGIQDSLIFGNMDGTPILAGLNVQITVPLYLKTDDSVTFVHFPVATDDDFFASRDGGTLLPPLSLWDDKSFLNPDLNSPSVGHTSQSILGFAYLFDPRDPQNFLYTGGQWLHIADYRMTTTSDIAVLGDTTYFLPGLNPANGDLVMGLQDGLTEIRPAVVWGSVFFPPNTPPYFVSPDSGTYPVNEQFGATFIVRANDPDTDSMVLTATFGPTNFTFTQITDIPGTISYRFSWVPGSGDEGTYPLSFTVNDGNGGVIVRNLTLVVSPAGLVISDETAMPGSPISVPVSLSNQGSSSAVGAFEILVTWSPNALTLNGVTRGGRLSTFEYFHINYDDAGQGTARIVGIADIRNGVVSPPLQPGTGPIFYLEMSVAPDENLIGVELPVSFLNLDQTDNTLSDSTGYLLVHPELTNGLITIIGPQDVLTGDINLNGIPYEVADVVLFVNHLTNPTAFPFNSVQREASDINADGLPETVADLIYLINIVNGNIMPPPLLDPATGNMSLLVASMGNQTIFRSSSQAELGGTLIRIAHHPGVTLVPSQDGAFTIAYHDDGNVLTVLAYLPQLPDGDRAPAGINNLFTLEANQAELSISEVSASDAIGHLLDTSFRVEGLIPATYELAQNYPNPFNAGTRITFGLPQGANVALEVYNITGQKVATLADRFFEAGRHNIIWDGSDNNGRGLSSGVYFYRLQTGSEVKTMKMTLLK